MVITNRSKNIQHFKSKLYRLRDESECNKKKFELIAFTFAMPRFMCH